MAQNIKERVEKIKKAALQLYSYITSGVWSDTHRSLLTDIVKTLNLTIDSFLNKNVQQKASALTYYTMLAFIPTLAMIFAIGRGFGFQNLLQTELFRYLPAQKEALSKAFVFVDSYLAQSSEGIFVGIGIIILLWSLISLLNNLENAFNEIWGVQNGRSLYRKITDYTAIMLLLPILMICEGGLTLFISSYSSSFKLLSPLATRIIDITPPLLSMLFFIGAFILIPNTKVKVKYTIIPGILSGIAFQVLQWLFVTGQIYVSKYNAIYGTFAFIPLLLVWLQFTWLITLTGVGLTYASQNFFNFDFHSDINDISPRYFNEIATITMAEIIRNFEDEKDPLSQRDLSLRLNIPVRMVNDALVCLVKTKLINIIDENSEGLHTYQPATDPTKLTLALFRNKVAGRGMNDFFKDFDEIYAGTLSFLRNNLHHTDADAILVKDIPLPSLNME